MKTTWMIAGLLAAVSAPATAATLVADTGWIGDTLDVAGQPTQQSAWTFTVGQASILSVIDCCIAGDVWTLSGDFNVSTSFFAGGAGDVQNDGSFLGQNWTSAAFSKLALNVGPGSYTFSLTGDGAGGLPAGVGVRLDTVAGIPEPATWALLISGFGMVGFAARRRRALATA